MRELHVSGSTVHYAELLARMRRSFDDGFRAERAPTVELTESLLLVRLGPDCVALRLAELTGIETTPTVVPVPAALPELIGLAGRGGTLMPVYSLGLLTGRPPSVETRHWIAVCRAAVPVAVAVDGLLGHIDAAASGRHPAGRDAGKHVSELVRTPDGFRPIVDLSSVLFELESLTSGRRAAAGSQTRED